VLGEYVQSHEDEQIKNDNKPRTLDCLYLRPTANKQGGRELLHLGTNRVIKRRRVTENPITPAVIKLVHEIAKKENMPKGLKIMNRKNVILFDTAWTAGVEYDEQGFDEDVDNPEYNSDEDESIESDKSDDHEEEIDHMDENELADILDDQYVINNDNEENGQQNKELNEGENNATEDKGEDEDKDKDENSEEYNEYEDDVPIQDMNESEDKEKAEDESINKDTNTNSAGVRKSTRQGNVPTRYGTMYQHLHSTNDTEEYSRESAVKLAHIMSQYAETNTRRMSKKKFYNFVQTYTLNKGRKKFGVEAKRAAFKEMR